MAGRVRGTSIVPNPPGSYTIRFQLQTPTNATQQSFVVYSDRCQDTVGNWNGENGLLIDKMDKRGIAPLSCNIVNPAGWTLVIRNWFPTVNTGSISHISQTIISDGALATEVLARSNPSKPYISVPNFLYEMKDLPGMIRDMGRLNIQLQNLARAKKSGNVSPELMAGHAAGHYLGAQFGWAPLISDLKKLLDFQKQVDRRINDLDRLFNKNGGLHRTVGKPNPKKGKPGGFVVTSQEFNPQYVTESVFFGVAGNIVCNFHKTTVTKRWGSVRWTAVSLPSNRYTNKELQSLATRLVFGANLNPEAIWDAIPWSWLIDWFTNVGTFLGAYTNVIPVHASTPLVMTHKRTVGTYTRVDNVSIISGGGGTTVLESKARNLATATLSASVPFLSARQLSILSALALQQLR
jgi:hypothetical protein